MKPKAIISSLRRSPLVGYVGALATVAGVSGVIAVAHLQDRLANTSILYLFAVLGSAVVFGSGPAIVAAIAAFLAFDFFFVNPTMTFTVADPAEWVSLILFLVTAIVTSQLAANQRWQAREAQRREREAVVLYDLARLTGDADLRRALRLAAERLRQDLQVSAIAIEVGDGSTPTIRAEAGDQSDLVRAITTGQMPLRLLGEGDHPTAERRGRPGRWIRVVPPRGVSAVSRARGPRPHLHVVPIRTPSRRVGTLLLARSADEPDFDPTDDRLLSAVVSQLGLAVDRDHLRREATEAEILRRTDDLKTALINMVSHDLRTPLASIVAGAESLLQRDVEWSDDDRQEFAEAIRSEALRLNQIVSNLLDLSRIEAGRLRPQKGWYDLRALVDDVVGRLRASLGGRPLLIDVSEDLPPVELDYVEIDEVLSNLVENAARYTPAEQPIEIRARRRGEFVEIEVADRGPGLPPEALARVFDAFYRAEGPRAQPKGIGLGLAVARGLVEAHGGRIRAENRAGGGARFAFTLPLGGKATPERDDASGGESRDEAGEGEPQPREVGE